MQGPCGHANKLCRQIIRKTTLQGREKSHAIVTGGNFVELELKVPDESDQDASDLEVSKLNNLSVSCEDGSSRWATHVFANATMSSSAKGLIHTLGSLTDKSVPIIHFLSGQVFLESPSSLATWIDPTVWVPFGMILPDSSVYLSECWGSDNSVAFGDDILSIFRRGGKGTRNSDIRDDRTLCQVRNAKRSCRRRRTIIVWMGEWRRKVSRMIPSRTGSSLISSYVMERRVPSGLEKCFTCSSYKASLKGW